MFNLLLFAVHGIHIFYFIFLFCLTLYLMLKALYRYRIRFFLKIKHKNSIRVSLSSISHSNAFFFFSTLLFYTKRQTSWNFLLSGIRNCLYYLFMYVCAWYIGWTNAKTARMPITYNNNKKRKSKAKWLFWKQKNGSSYSACSSEEIKKGLIYKLVKISVNKRNFTYSKEI